MTPAEVVAGAVAAHKRCTGRARAPSGSWQWVCGYLAPAGEGYALSAERHLAHHIALAIEAHTAAVAKEAFWCGVGWLSWEVGRRDDEPEAEAACVARLTKEGAP